MKEATLQIPLEAALATAESSSSLPMRAEKSIEAESKEGSESLSRGLLGSSREYLARALIVGTISTGTLFTSMPPVRYENIPVRGGTLVASGTFIHSATTTRKRDMKEHLEAASADDAAEWQAMDLERSYPGIEMSWELDPTQIRFSDPPGRPASHEQLAASFALRRPVAPDPDDLLPWPDDID
jgi:hypothetical protein